MDNIGYGTYGLTKLQNGVGWGGEFDEMLFQKRLRCLDVRLYTFSDVRYGSLATVSYP